MGAPDHFLLETLILLHDLEGSNNIPVIQLAQIRQREEYRLICEPSSAHCLLKPS